MSDPADGVPLNPDGIAIATYAHLKAIYRHLHESGAITSEEKAGILEDAKGFADDVIDYAAANGVPLDKDVIQSVMSATWRLAD